MTGVPTGDTLRGAATVADPAAAAVVAGDAGALAVLAAGDVLLLLLLVLCALPVSALLPDVAGG